MNRLHTLSLAAIALVAGTASAQIPTLIPLSGMTPSDATSSLATGVVVVGMNGATSNAFVWTPAGGAIDIGVVAGGSNIKVSVDGSTVVANTVGGDGISRASYWRSTTGWVQIPGIGGTSGTTETSVYGVNADGTVIVGLGWVTGGAGHAFRWNTGTGSVDLTPPFSSPSSRGNDVNGPGTVVYGWHDSFSGQRNGARWTGGVETLFTYTDPGSVTYNVGEALAVNQSGSTVVGYNVFGLSGNGWRWDASSNAITLLPNLPAYTNAPLPADVTDDGSIVIGSNGGSPFDRRSIVWLQGQPPQSLFTWLVNQGGVGFASYTDLGTPRGMSRSGDVMVGAGGGSAFSQPQGWIVRIDPAGVRFCAGDGVDTSHTTPCPCGNIGALGRGCANSVNANGGDLQTTGAQAQDTVVLHGSGMPATVACIYLQGTLLEDTTFGDGVRCAGGTLLRLRTKVNVGGASSFPDSVETVTLSERGGVVVGSGERRYYQTYYRNAAGTFCPPETFNVTNGVIIDW